jgi:DNA-binding NarL/FixJ family response regulator
VGVLVFWWIAVAKIRVVLADDHQQTIARVRQTLGEEFEVVGAVEDSKQAVSAVLTLNPDVLIIDISMPVLNGLHAAKQLQTADCRAKVIFLTIYEGRDFLDAAFSAGASAYVNKARLSTDLIPAVHEAMLGQIFISAPVLMQRVTGLRPREGVLPEKSHFSVTCRWRSSCGS